ncbi:MAG: CvpA family protein [Candidatus Delongbacteria bacterium]|nr:CvpA family protein [Candidatus Delongbacteria bacterium]
MILVFFLGLKGLFRGFVREFFGLAGIVGGVYIASRVSDSFGIALGDFFAIQSESTSILIAFIITLAIVWIIIYSIGLAVSKATQLSGLGIFDRFLGFVFGASKIFLIFAIIVYALTQVEVINEKLKTKTKNSIMFPILKDTGDYIVKINPSALASQVSSKTNKSIESIKQKAGELKQSATDEANELKEEIKQKVEETKNDENN